MDNTNLNIFQREFVFALLLIHSQNKSFVYDKTENVLKKTFRDEYFFLFFKHRLGFECSEWISKDDTEVFLALLHSAFQCHNYNRKGFHGLCHYRSFLTSIVSWKR